MKITIKKILFIAFVMFFLNITKAQVKSTNESKISTELKESLEKKDIETSDQKYQSQIIEQNKQIASLTQTVASTKESFYNTNIYLWTFIITTIGFIVAIFGSLGYRNISQKLKDLKFENEKLIAKTEVNIRDNKTDLIQRLTEIKSDIKEFKETQSKHFEKFEKDANDKMDKGLGSALQEAIEKIMKESFVGEMNGISEQVSDLKNQFENLSSKSSEQQNLIPENNDGLPLKEKGTIKPNKNAFDE